jgi:thiol-disulfide isomerase/thioredoxin
MLLRAHVLLGVIGLALLGCARAAEPTSTTSPPSPVPTGFTRVIVHSDIDTPVGLRIDPVFAVGGTHPQLAEAIGRSDFAKTDAFPQELLCPSGGACTVHVRNELKVVVFAFEPTVEVTITPPGTVRYHAKDTLSATLGELLARGKALGERCGVKDTERATAIEGALRETATSGAHEQVRRAAALLLVQHQCSGAQENVALAQHLLEELDPTAPELVLWTDAVAMLGDVAHDEKAETALVDAMIERHPSEHVVALLLLGRLFATLESGDAEAREALSARLREPRFVRTSAPTFARQIVAIADPLHVDTGDAMPAIEVPLLDGGTLSSAKPRSGPMLVYFSASWCKGCVESLPKLRALAKDHPELEIAYVLWESAASAKTYVQRHAPIPGKIAHTEDEHRKAIQQTLLKVVVLPTFVLVDAGGKVIATSKEGGLDVLPDKLSSN